MVTIDVPAAARNFAYFGELIDKIDGAVTLHRRGCISLHSARALRGGRLHRAVELSPLDGCLEGRAGSGRRQFGGVEAGPKQSRCQDC